MASIPIFVDSTSPSGDTRFARCTYFCIDAANTEIDWLLSLRNDRIPFLLVGASCILTSPLGADMFTHSHQIEELFTLVESNDGLLVEVNDLLVPSHLLAAEGSARGSVLRVEEIFFRRAHAFRAGRLPQEEYLAAAPAAEPPLHFSSEETAAFRAWENNIINEARTYYRENRANALPWSGPDDSPGSGAEKRPPPPDLPPPSGLGKFPFVPFQPARQPSWQGQGLNA